MSKVLLIAPVPTHPSTTGASARVRHMADGLLSLGHEVHFLYLQQSLRAADTPMRQYWKERLHPFRSLSPASFLGRGRRKLVRLVGKAFHLNLPVDSYFDPEAAGYLGTLLARGFEVAILSYVFYSKLFEFAPDSVRKLLDTHDVFSDRYRLYRAHGQANEFFSTGKAEEAKALDRADAVLAIQEWDASHFRSLTTRTVTVVGHLAPVVEAAPVAAGDCARAMLFVGGPMGINVHGVTWFIDRVLPAVRRRVPEAELWLVGGIGKRIRSDSPGVRRFGFVDSLGDLYRQAAVVINPQQFGTGLSIKSVDALQHGRPLVTTVSGARGLEEGAESCFRQAGSAEEFSELLIELLRDPEQAAALGRRATDFARRYYQRNLQALADVVAASPRSPTQ
ncbi:MAG TPA: glycosyltransferase family 4 protein [Gemmatimonadales bacterium]|jgi:glycosyltransferase involved in cell wall biosynthesis|nr:glycosyltransferase family 4 protein [Gemmatimonadales bacterium]